MVYVRLEKAWTDDSGTTHSAGEMVDVDVATLAALEASGVVDENDGGDPHEHSETAPTPADD